MPRPPSTMRKRKTVAKRRAPASRALAAPSSFAPYKKRGNQSEGYRQTIYFDPFPSMLRTTMRYVDTITLTTTALSDDPVYYDFSCNGIHDPNITGTGHQPYGHDQVAALYNHYSVQSSRCTITPNNSNDKLVYGLEIHDGGASVGFTDNALLERKRVVFAHMQQDSIAARPLSQTWKKEAAFPKGAEGKNLNASYGSNPGEQMYFRIFLKNTITSSAPATITFTVAITYQVISYEMKELAQS